MLTATLEHVLLLAVYLHAAEFSPRKLVCDPDRKTLALTLQRICYGQRVRGEASDATVGSEGWWATQDSNLPATAPAAGVRRERTPPKPVILRRLSPKTGRVPLRAGSAPGALRKPPRVAPVLRSLPPSPTTSDD